MLADVSSNVKLISHQQVIVLMVKNESGSSKKVQWSWQSSSYSCWLWRRDFPRTSTGKDKWIFYMKLICINFLLIVNVNHLWVWKSWHIHTYSTQISMPCWISIVIFFLSVTYFAEPFFVSLDFIRVLLLLLYIIVTYNKIWPNSRILSKGQHKSYCKYQTSVALILVVSTWQPYLKMYGQWLHVQ